MSPEHRLSDFAFGMAFAAIFAAVAAVGWFFWDVQLLWAMLVSTSFLLLALLQASLLMPLNRLWGWFAFKLGHVVNTVLLGGFYFLFLLPLGVLMRVLGKDFLRLKSPASAASFWVPVEKREEPDHLTDMF